MKRVAAVSAVVAVLVLGILVGILGTHLFYAQKLRQAGSFSKMAGRFFAERLDRELALTVEQREAIDAILEETQVEAHAIREEIRPWVDALMEGSKERITEILTPEQRERFEVLRERHRRRAEHFFLGPPGRPRRPPGRRPWRERPMEGYEDAAPGESAPEEPAPADTHPDQAPPDDGT